MTTSRAGGRSWLLALTVAAAVSGAAPARAAYLSFNLNAQSGDGRVSYAGGSAPLIGKDLGVLGVKGLDTTSHNDATLDLEKGRVNFTTGGFTHATPGDPATGSGLVDFFGKGGSLTVTGGIASLGIAPDSPLLTGTFSDGSFVRDLPGTALKVTGAAFFNVVNDKLAAYFGLPVGGTMYIGGISTLIASASPAGGAFVSNGYTSGQVTTTPVPEPGTLAVFGLFAAGGFALTRRRAA